MLDAKPPKPNKIFPKTTTYNTIIIDTQVDENTTIRRDIKESQASLSNEQAFWWFSLQASNLNATYKNNCAVKNTL